MNIHLHCPHCKNPIELVEVAPRQELTCTACGSSFKLENLATTGWTPTGSSVGRFEIVDEIGHGGFGTVYRARDPQLDRLVALKVPRRSNIGDQPQDLERFLREARSVAQLRHASIVSVHEVGTENGTPYLVCDFVEGITLADLLTARRPTPQEAARLVADVAEALHYAHQQGVVHRDVKPSNIMLERASGGQVNGDITDHSLLAHYSPKLLDFGLAKRDAGEITMTVNGEILGTPAYMSPEQARGDAHKVDGRSDIYSVGVILYQMLTGELPFRGNKRMLLHQVLHDEPHPPRGTNDRIPRDLETITLKAMAKEPARRYATAQELADDLRRFLRNEPIRARPVGQTERLWRWCRRNPLVAGLTGTVAAVLLASAIVASALAVWALDERDRADREAAAATKNERDAKANATLAKINETLARKNEDLAKRYAAETRLEVERFYVAEGLRHARDGDISRALLWFAKPLDAEGDAGAAEDLHRQRLSNYWRYTSKPVLTQCFLHPWVDYAEFSPDGTRIVTASADLSDRTARVWNAATGKLVLPPLKHADGVNRATFSPDGRRILTASHDAARLWDAATGQPIGPALGHKRTVNWAAFSPDGSHVVTASADGTARIWNAADGTAMTEPLKHKGALSYAVFSGDGRRVATAGDQVQIWDVASGRSLIPPLEHESWVKLAVFSPDGRLLLTASAYKARIWDAATGKLMGTLNHEGAVYRASFSPDGRRVVTASEDMTGRVWDASDGRELARLRHQDELWDAVFSPDGRHVLTCSDDGTARVWDAATGQALGAPLQHQGAVPCAKFSGDGRRIVTTSYDGTDGSVRIWDLAGGQATLPHITPLGEVSGHAAFSPDGTRVLYQGRVWDALSGQPLTPSIGQPGSIQRSAFSRDGRRIVSVSRDQTALVWDAATGRPISAPMKHPREVRLAAFSPDGSRVVTVFAEQARVWDATSGEPVTPVLKHAARIDDADFSRPARINHAGFSPDGRRLVTASDDGMARLWDASTGEPTAPPLKSRDNDAVLHASFSPDGRRIVTASKDKTARIWDMATGQPIAIPLRHRGAVNRAVFSPDGRRIITASADYTARIWDAATGQPLTPPLQHQGIVERALFNADGSRVVTASNDDTVRVWHASTGQPLTPPLVHQTPLAQARFGFAGQHVLTSAQNDAPRTWDITSLDRPAADWVLLTQLFCGKLDRVGGIQPQSREEMEQAWNTLRTKYPQDFTVTADQALAWHRGQAQACLKEKNESAFLVHYFHGHIEWPLLAGWPRW